MPRGINTGVPAKPRRVAVAVFLLAAIALGEWAKPLTAQGISDPPGEGTVDIPASPLAGRRAADIQALAEGAIKRLDLQTELRREPEPLGFHIQLPDQIVWVSVAIGLAILLYAFRDMIPILGRGRGAWADDEDGALATGRRTPEVVLGTADELAAQGRFVEAMHVLLLQALVEIRRRLEEEFADSMTSREILRSKRLSDELRRPLRDVVARVEWTYFGEHPAAQDDYLACRASFGALTQALHGQALRGSAAA